MIFFIGKVASRKYQILEQKKVLLRDKNNVKKLVYVQKIYFKVILKGLSMIE